LSETFIPLFNAPVVHQDITDLAGTSQRLDHAREYYEEQIRLFAITDAWSGFDLVKNHGERLRIQHVHLLV